MVLAQGLMGLQDPATHSHESREEASATHCGLFSMGLLLTCLPPAQVMERESNSPLQKRHMLIKTFKQ